MKETHAENLERLLLKQSVRFHGLSIVHGVGNHNGTFRECNSPICREQKTALVGSKAYRELYNAVDAFLYIAESQS